MYGCYRERIFDIEGVLVQDGTYFVGDILKRDARTIHILTLDRPVWTLVLHGPATRNWGFVTGAGWVDHKTYLEANK